MPVDQVHDGVGCRQGRRVVGTRIISSGEKLSLGGFMAVNREKAKALPAEKLSELAKTDELELLYLHLYSMRNFPAMAQRLFGKSAPANQDDSTLKPHGQPETQPAQAQATQSQQ